LTAVAKKLFSYFLKAAILVLAFTFIYHQYLKKGDNLKQFQIAVNRLSHQHVVVIMSVVVFLMFANWLVECLKWQHLTRRLAPISLWKAIEGVFCGLTWAVFTPNRIGEYGGRVMFLPPRKRIHGVFAMAVGSFGQNVITNVLGAGALLWFCYTFLNLNAWALTGITIFGVIFMGLFLVLYFNIKWLVKLLNSISFLKKYHRFFDIMGAYTFAELIDIMCFCLTRFFIFSFQYYLVIHLLVPEIPFHDVMLMVFIVFFVQSALPSLDLLDVPVRATAAATVFAYVTGQQIAIIAAFSSIWLINLIIPAILGSVFIFKLKFFDRSV
jgi:hypothetical protein